MSERALNPRAGDVWRRERQRRHTGEWYMDGERLVKTLTVTDGRTRLRWVNTVHGATARRGFLGNQATTAKAGGGRECSMASWGRWTKERGYGYWVGQHRHYTRGSLPRLTLIRDGATTKPSRHEVYDMARRLAEKGYGDLAEELCFCSNRIWEVIEPARVRMLLEEAEGLLQ